jgi:toxin ParE1/3/4
VARVVWSERALAHLDAIAGYIAQDSPRLAQLFVRRVFDATDQLTAFPRSGRRVPEFSRDDLREIFLDRYRIIYRVTEDDVEIAAVRHGARLLRQTDLESDT